MIVLHVVIIVTFLIALLNKIGFLFSAGHAIGRDSFLDYDIILPVAALFDDKADIARKNAHKAIEMVSETPPGKYIRQCSILITAAHHIIVKNSQQTFLILAFNTLIFLNQNASEICTGASHTVHAKPSIMFYLSKNLAPQELVSWTGHLPTLRSCRT